MRPKTLNLPNGNRITSDQVQRVRAFPGRSPSFHRVYMEIYDEHGLVYEGIIDLDRAADP